MIILTRSNHAYQTSTQKQLTLQHMKIIRTLLYPHNTYAILIPAQLPKHNPLHSHYTREEGTNQPEPSHDPRQRTFGFVRILRPGFVVIAHHGFVRIQHHGFALISQHGLSHYC